MADNSYAVWNLQVLKENIMAYASYAEGHSYSPLYEKMEAAQAAVQKLIDAIEGKEEERPKVYVVVYTCFEGYDDNLYTNSRAFADKERAEAYFKKECRTALADARREEQSSDPSEWTHVEENLMEDVYRVSRFNETYYTKVELKEMEL